MDILCKIESEKDAKEKEKQYTEDEKHILCSFCYTHITDHHQRIQVNDAHRHVFANPHGIVFEIGCFKTAKGCFPFEESSTEFTWFPGYSWRISICRNCMNHLGWYFVSRTDSFFGLIIERLVMQ